MNCYSDGPTTERLWHREFKVDDAETFYALSTDPRIIQYTGDPASGPAIESVEAARQAIADYPDFRTVGFGRWASVARESKRVIGFCGLKYLSDLKVVDVGYRFLPEFWGRGLATEACTAAITFGFEQVGLSEIVGLVMPGKQSVGSSAREIRTHVRGRV